MIKSKIYNDIGKTYNTSRQADTRIMKTINSSLNLPSKSVIADIGAGTGNYSFELAKLGYNVIAIEPSEVMRLQGRKHTNLVWVDGTAEELPLPDNSVDAIISTLAIHHFSDLKKSFSEMNRVVRSRGKIVIFIADPRLCEDNCWLYEYFSTIIKNSYESYRPINEVVDLLSIVTGNIVEIVPFMVPHNIKDGFFISAWRNPNLYLDKNFRSGISPLAKAPTEILDPIIRKLESDLKEGEWLLKYKEVLEQEEYEGGYRFLISEGS